jgi:hypothetical protein
MSPDLRADALVPVNSDEARFTVKTRVKAGSLIEVNSA